MLLDHAITDKMGMVGQVGLSRYFLLPGMGGSWFSFPERVTGIYPTFPTIATLERLSGVCVEMLDPWVGNPL